jgi:hypothetical protein
MTEYQFYMIDLMHRKRSQLTSTPGMHHFHIEDPETHHVRTYTEHRSKREK